mgnify:FL=1
MRTYQEATDRLGTRDSRKVGNNTYLVRRGDNIALRLHRTDVVTFQPDNSVVLDSGGWLTVTTKNRMNEVVRVYSEKGKWYAEGIPYADGMVIHADGSTEGEGVEEPKADKAIKAKVKAYAQLCADSLPVEPPDSGDCWFCLFKTEDGRTMGDLWGDTEHFNSHMDEGYVVSALIYNALKAHNNAPMAFWGAFKSEQDNSFALSFARGAVSKAVYRYILRREGFQI